MGRLIQDEHGKWRELQDPSPTIRPQGAAPDCAYCLSKGSCMGPKNAGASEGKRLYVGEKHPPCGSYREVNEQFRKDEELKKLKDIFDSVPRPKGAKPDCLHCRFLPMKLGIVCRSGPWQGRQKICDNYKEIPVRKKQPNCLFCLKNSNCPNDRVTKGQICNDYLEIPIKLEGNQKHCLFCLQNWNCLRDRVMRDGRPCEKYSEFDSGGGQK